MFIRTSDGVFVPVEDIQEARPVDAQRVRVWLRSGGAAREVSADDFAAFLHSARGQAA